MDMSPRQEDKKEPPVADSPAGSGDEQNHDMAEEEDEMNEEEFDLEEIAALNENLDNLNAALDTIEARADDMREKVLQLLMSNRELMKGLKEDPAGDEGGSDDQCNHVPGKPAEEA